jgi:hypothetical protein
VRSSRVAASLTPLAATLALLSGCNGKTAPARDGAASTVTTSVQTTPVAGAPCTATGHWVPCQVEKRLEMTGLAPRDSAIADTVRLGPTPIVYVAGGSAIAVYLFPDSLSRHRAAARLDTTKFIAPSAALTMRREATAIQNDNLLAILYSQRDQQRERVSDALMAGAPGH